MEEDKSMNKIRYIKGVLVMLFAITALLAFLPDAGKAFKPSKTMPKLLVLDDPANKVSEYAGDKGKTPFDHEQHIKYSQYQPQDKCVVCHHTNSKNLTEAVEEDVLKCSVCHKGEETTNEIEGTNEDKKFKGLAAINAEDAYHGNDSVIGCIGCHKERDIEPKGCKECHTDSDTIEYKYKKK